MTDDLVQDQDTGIWRPRRRTFIVMAGTILGPTGAPADTGLVRGWKLGEVDGLSVGVVGLGTITLGQQPDRAPQGPKEYIIRDGRAVRNPEYRGRDAAMRGGTVILTS